MANALWIIGPLAVVGLMYFAASKTEPHWVSRDGHRFLCQAQVLTAQGAVDGKPRELRIIVRPDGLLRLDHRRAMRRPVTEIWRLVGKSPDPPPRRAVYLLQPGRTGPAGAGVPRGQIALRLPERSRAVAVLDNLVAQHAAAPPARPGAPNRPDDA